MKKIIPFTKDIKFNTKIYEITSISLENTLTIESNGEIDGEFIVSGEYKMNDSSINTEPFIYGLPFNIEIDDNYDINTIKLDIDDFKYEIINEEILKVDIDVSVEGSIKIEKEEDKKEEEINPDVIIEARLEKENKNIKKMEVQNMIEEKDLFKEEENTTKVIKEDNIKQENISLFENYTMPDDEYVSYYVHIIRENDTIESICKKYNITKDDLDKYNSNEKITLGNKLIIPYIENDKTI